MPEGDNKLLAGGPMMGKALTSTEVPICKGTNSVTILSDDDARRKEPQPCIRCAKCVSVCPMGLEPYLLAKLSAFKNWEKSHYKTDAGEHIRSECRAELGQPGTTVQGLPHRRAPRPTMAGG